MSTSSEPNRPLIVPDDAVWYVKTGLDRAMRNAQNSIREANKRIASLKARLATEPNDPYLATFIAETEYVVSYYEQWLREASEAYRTLPKKLQPLALTEDD